MRAYDHKKIEKKWQKKWQKDALYTTLDSVKGKDNFHLLVEFPYPSGNLHVGHWYAFAVPDILARMLHMQGKNVLYPIGFDAFGLPAENAAIKNKLNPRDWTLSNIEYMKKQIQSMGTSFDWSREVVTCDPAYYKWTQWLFLQFFKKGLVYRKETAVNWCPKDKTVLANEQVVNGKCERCESEVVQKQMLQWNIKITDYADRLIDDLEKLDWPKEIKESQRNWIGRSEGAEIDFPLVLDEKKYKYVILHGLHGFDSAANRNRFQWMKEELEKFGHSVVTPSLPDPNNPSENEQVTAALNATTYDENTVLCGFSLGSVVALKVVEKLKSPIARLVTVGGFCDANFKDKNENHRNFEDKFIWNFDGNKIRKNVRSITILHDPKDHAISNEQAQALSRLLETPLTIGVSNKSHFNGDTEPDVLMWLRPTIRVFTTRADTLFGGTYLVLAPEHPLLRPDSAEASTGKQGFGGQAWVTALENRGEVEKYIAQAQKKTELERMTDQKEKTGVELKGVKAINPATGEKIPLYVADYVLGHYGTGAIMAVPAHDERDFEFAKKFGLQIREVIQPLVINRIGPDALKEGEPLVERHAVMGIIKHWKDEKYLVLDWKQRHLHALVTGGAETGEDTAAAFIREIREETGYKNVRSIRPLGAVHSQFYHVEKNQNRYAHLDTFLVELTDGTHEDPSPYEQNRHIPVWIARDAMMRYLDREDFKITWARALKESAYSREGILANSDTFDGMGSKEARKAITEKFGRKKTTYKLRDWIVSRQRYWGVPIPIVHCATCGTVAVADKDLPVELPEIKDYLPEGSGKSPLAKAKKWVKVKCPQCAGPAERETDTLDTFVDSSWYFLRYTDPKNKKEFASSAKMEKWMPVDLYSGGAEHTTMHLLYSRFWHKALFDLGLVKDAEPYKKRMNRSLILGPDGQKMSKSRGNVVDPDEVVKQLGADTVRMYLAFIGPYNEVSSFPWNPDGVVGIRRFLERVHRLSEKIRTSDVRILDGMLNKTIKKVSEDIMSLKFNTAISQLMIFLNYVEKEKSIGKNQWERFLKLLGPFAPHIAEELWEMNGHKKSLHEEKWPEYNPELLKDETVTFAIQINGKTRGEVSVAADADKTAIEARACEAVAGRLEGKRVVRTIVVPGRLVNFVVEE